MIWWQPQKPIYSEGDGIQEQPEYRIPLMPFLPATVVALNAILAAYLMPEIWPGIILWTGAGKYN